MKKRLIFLLLLAIIFISFPNVMAGHVGCGLVGSGQISFDSTIILDSDLFCSGSGIQMASGQTGSGITLDCAGYVIQGPGIERIGPSPQIGIDARNMQNIKIKNCKIQNFEAGIAVILGGNNILENNTLIGNKLGIYVESSVSNALISNTAINNTHIGFFLYNSDNNLLTDNKATNGSDMGFLLQGSSHNNLVSNIAENNHNQGFV